MCGTATDREASASSAATYRRWPQWLAKTFRALEHRNYRLYFFGQMVSFTGSWMQTTALMWLAFELTGKSRWPAAMAAAQLLPTCILGPWGGWAADRWPKRRLILLTQASFTLQAFALSAVTLAGSATAWGLLGLTLASGIVQAVDLPARLAFVTELAGRDDLMNAVGLNSLLFNVARALGPALAAPFLYFFGPGVCFLLNGLSFLAVLWALARMDPAALITSAGAGPRPSGPVWSGFTYLARRPDSAFLIGLAGVVCVGGWPFLALLPGLARRALQSGSDAYGAMLSGTGLGALAAAWTLARTGRPAHWRRIVTCGMVLLTTALLGLALCRSAVLAVGASAAVGFGLILLMVTGQSVVQLSADDAHRGRVMAVWAMVVSGAIPLGNVLTGWAADAWGEPVVLGIQGLGCAALAAMLAVVSWLWKRTEALPGVVAD